MPVLPTPSKARVGAIIRAAKKLAKQYRRETGRPLGITGEVAEYEAGCWAWNWHRRGRRATT